MPSYTKTNWKDYPSTETPITASNLNKIEDAIDYLFVNGTGGGGESLPVGSEIEFDGSASNIPAGWEKSEDDYNVYSTDEKQIGTWIDGKPIYRKVICDTTVREIGNYNIPHGISNLENVAHLETLCWQNSTTMFNATSTSPLSGSERATSYLNGDNISIRNSWGCVKIIIIIEYTKTTD